MDKKRHKIFNARPVFYGFLALMLALCTSRYVFCGNFKYIILDLVAILAFVTYCIFFKRYKILAIVLSVFVFGLGWYFVGQATFKPNQYDQICQVSARVSDDIEIGEYNQVVILKDVTINGKKESNLQLTISNTYENQLEAGDLICFESYIESARLFELENFNNSFHRKKVLYVAKVKFDDVIIVGSKLTVDEKVRLKVKEALFENMGEENGAVAYAVLFGDKSNVSSDVISVYKNAGIIHLLTVSGLHVSFLIALLGFVLKKLKTKGWLNFLICLTFLLLYAWFCGFSPSVIRAGIMGLVLLASTLTGKCYDNLTSVGFAGSLILLCSPLTALDVGFQMSIFCVVSIFVLAPVLDNIFRKVFPKAIAVSMAVSISATVGILPFSAKIFSTLNLLSVFANLIVVPLFSVVYPLLFVFAFVVAVLPFMGFLLKICNFSFDFIEMISNFFAQTSLKFNLKPLSIFASALFMLGLFLVGKFFMTSRKTKMLCCAVVFVPAFVLMGFGDNWISAKSSIACAYQYGNSVVLITNKAKESVIIDMAGETFVNRFAYSVGVEKVSTMFLVQNDDLFYDQQWQSFGVENVVRCDKTQGFDEEVLVQKNQISRVGNFVFEYVEIGQELVGLKLQFDQTKMFVFAKDKGVKSEIAQAVAQEDYDVVIIGKNQQISQYFDKKCNIFGFYNEENVDFSFAEHGNVCCKISNEKITRRCLD
jgi:ComEC/Rec2-related protein